MPGPRTALFLGLVLLMPVPYLLADLGWAPVVRHTVLSAALLAVWLAEGGMLPALMAGVLGVQALVWTALCFWLAGQLGRLPPAWRWWVAAGGVLALLVAAQAPIYKTPLSSQAARASIWGILD